MNNRSEPHTHIHNILTTPVSRQRSCLVYHSCSLPQVK